MTPDEWEEHHRKRDRRFKTITTILLTAFWLTVVIGWIVYSFASMEECTRVHPAWYCIGN